MNEKPHYGVKCPECKKRMFSMHVHDYRLCGCPNETMVDGGTSYLRYGFKFKKPKRIKYDSKIDLPYPSNLPKDHFPY